MVLELDGDATVTGPFFAKGRWRQEGSRVIVDLGGEPMVFDYAEDSLTAKQWDRAIWGDAGPGTLRRESTSGRGLRG